MSRYVKGQRVYAPGYQSYVEVIGLPDKDDEDYLVQVESGYHAGCEVVLIEEGMTDDRTKALPILREH